MLAFGVFQNYLSYSQNYIRDYKSFAWASQLSYGLLIKM